MKRFAGLLPLVLLLFACATEPTPVDRVANVISSTPIDISTSDVAPTPSATPTSTPAPTATATEEPLPDGALAQLRCGYQVLSIMYESDDTTPVIHPSLNVARCEASVRERQVVILAYADRGHVALSPSGAYLAAGAPDGSVRVFDVVTGEEVVTLLEENDDGLSPVVSWSPDEHLLAGGSARDVLRIWELPNVEPVATFRYMACGVISLAWSPDGQYLACGGNIESVNLWDTATWDRVGLLRGPNIHANLWDVTWSTDGARVAGGTVEGTVLIWDVNTEELLMILEGHQSEVTTIALSPNGRWLASGSLDVTTRVWDFSTGEELALFQRLDGDSPVSSVQWAPDGSLLASGHYDDTVILWDTSNLPTP